MLSVILKWIVWEEIRISLLGEWFRIFDWVNKSLNPFSYLTVLVSGADLTDQADKGLVLSVSFYGLYGSCVQCHFEFQGFSWDLGIFGFLTFYSSLGSLRNKFVMVLWSHQCITVRTSVFDTSI